MKVPAALLAFGYTFLALFAMALTFALVEQVSPGAADDMPTLVVSQLIGYGLAFFVMLRVQAPEGDIAEVLALTPFTAFASVLGLGLGALAYPACDYVDAWVLRRWPPHDPVVSEGFDVSTPQARLRLGLCLLIALPLASELFFRGAVTYAVKTQWYAAFVVSVLANFSRSSMVSLLVVASLCTLLRYRFRSTWPAAFAHIGFYATPLVPMLMYARQEVRLPVSFAWGGGGLVVVAMLVLAGSWPRSHADHSSPQDFGVGSNP